MIIYRVLGFLPKPLLKVLHAALHMCAIIASTIGLVAVLEYHRRTERPDFYSLHSWIGIATFGMFCFQVNMPSLLSYWNRYLTMV